jgi:hypothetical protein
MVLGNAKREFLYYARAGGSVGRWVGREIGVWKKEVRGAKGIYMLLYL